MNGIVANLTRPASHRLARVALVFACSVLSVCLIGAVHTKPFVASKPPTPIVPAEDLTAPLGYDEDDAAPAAPLKELMYDAPTNAASDPKQFAAPVSSNVLKSLVPVPVVPASQQFAVRMMEVTAFCACKKCWGPRAQGITASGRPVTYNGGRFVAADKAISFNTKLVIPGYGDGQAVPVLDRGGAIKGNKLDVYFPTHAEARQWGRRFIPVTVVNWLFAQPQ
jgi:3D (Asp-Asp-Asp) domain-containing protein